MIWIFLLHQRVIVIKSILYHLWALCFYLDMVAVVVVQLQYLSTIPWLSSRSSRYWWSFWDSVPTGSFFTHHRLSYKHNVLKRLEVVVVVPFCFYRIGWASPGNGGDGLVYISYIGYKAPTVHSLYNRQIRQIITFQIIL
jgi:hypothetical protein